MKCSFSCVVKPCVAIVVMVCMALLSPVAMGVDRMIAHVPVRAVDSNGQAQWFGYYDKHQFDSTDRFLLAMRPPQEGQTPGPDDVVEVGYIDLEQDDKWTSIGSTRAWNWQQGSMLQWLPKDDKIIYNDRRDGKFVSIIHEPKTKTDWVLPYPVYTVSPDGRHAATLNFARLAFTRPGYGYTGVPYAKLDERIPADEGVFLVDLETGKRTVLYSLEQIAAVDFREGMHGGLNWVNHLLFNTDGSRLIFLHRWREDEKRKEGKLHGRWKTRMVTIGLDGKAPNNLIDHGMVSHFIWRSPSEILAWSNEPDTKQRFHLYNEVDKSIKVIGEGILTRDGHCTYSPDGEWILTDTYPDKDRMQHLMLYRPVDGKLVELGRFFQDKAFGGEIRCDLHPRWSRDGKTVCIDSLHSGTRQMYLLDVSSVVASK